MKGINLYLVNGMYWITASLYLPFISMFFTQKGMDAMQVGILSSVIPMSALFIQPIWTRLSDNRGKRRQVLILLNLCCAASVLLFLFTDTFLQIFMAVALYAFFNSAVLPICDALVVSQSEKQGLNFAWIRMCGTISYAVVVLGMGFYLKKHLNVMFLVSSLSFILFSIACLTLPVEKKQTVKMGHDASDGKGKIFKDNSVYLVFVFAFAMQFGINYYSTFLGVYLIELGYNQSLVGVLNCISAISEIPILLCIHKFSGRYRETVLLAFAVFCMALRLVLLSVGNVLFMVIAQILQGPSYMICYFVCVTYINKMAKPGKISQGQGMLALVQMGLGSLGGTLIGGLLASAFGVKQGFLIVAAVLLIMVGVTAALQKWGKTTNEKK